jgi:hypothetical protein
MAEGPNSKVELSTQAPDLSEYQWHDALPPSIEKLSLRDDLGDSRIFQYSDRLTIMLTKNLLTAQKSFSRLQTLAFQSIWRGHDDHRMFGFPTALEDVCRTLCAKDGMEVASRCSAWAKQE